MQSYALNHRGLECLKALVRAGQFDNRPWKFTVDDSNGLLGNPPNYTQYSLNFLGVANNVPDTLSDSGASPQPEKEYWAYPFTRGQGVSLDGLKQASADAKRSGDSQIFLAAQGVLADAILQLDQQTKASWSKPMSRKISKPILVAAAALTGGVPESIVAATYGDEVTDSARRMGGLGFSGLIHSCCELDGVPCDTGKMSPEIIRAGFTTASFPVLMSNIANLVLAAAFNADNAITPLVAGKVDLRNLNTSTIYRLTADGSFAQVPKSGEIKSGALSESTYPLTPGTYARALELDRQILLNDDVGAFTSMGKIFGRAAFLQRDKLLTEMILANAGSFFSAGNGNYESGGGSALSATSLATAAKSLRETKDNFGELLLIKPSILLVPSALEETALTLQRNTTTCGPDVITNAGRYTPMVAAHLGTTSGLTGASDTGWYLLGDPVDLPAFYVGYLHGQDVPVFEQGMAEFSSLGMYFRAIYDLGVAFGEPKAAVFNAGV